MAEVRAALEPASRERLRRPSDSTRSQRCPRTRPASASSSAPAATRPTNGSGCVGPRNRRRGRHAAGRRDRGVDHRGGLGPGPDGWSYDQERARATRRARRVVRAPTGSAPRRPGRRRRGHSRRAAAPASRSPLPRASRRSRAQIARVGAPRTERPSAARVAYVYW